MATFFVLVNTNKGLPEAINGNLLATNEGPPLQQQIERFWEIVSYAVKQVLSEPTLPVEDKRALAILQRSTMKDEGRNKTALLSLPDNRVMLVSRLCSTEKKLNKNPQLEKDFSALRLVDEVVQPEGQDKTISPAPEQQTNNLNTDYVKEVSLALGKIAWNESLKKEYKDLQANRELSSKSSLFRLQPVLIEDSEVTLQIILSPPNPFSRLLVQDFDERQFHARREHTLALVRRQFWIQREKSFTRKIVNDCLH